MPARRRLALDYPAEPRNRSERDDDFEVERYHPFADELPAPNGHFYPRHSTLRRAAFNNGMVYLERPKARIYELEKRRVAEELSPAEEEELQELRRRQAGFEKFDNLAIFTAVNTRLFGGFISAPEDREPAVRKLIETAGGKVLSFYFTTDESDFLLISQAEEPEAIVAALMAASASGAVSHVSNVRAWTGVEFKSIAEKLPK